MEQDQLAILLERIQWQRAWLTMEWEWMQATGHPVFSARSEFIHGQLAGLMTAWKELNHLKHGKFVR